MLLSSASIEYFINADDGGPVATQRALYHRIAENYPELLRHIMPLLQREYVQMVGRDVPIQDAKFNLNWLSVAANESDSMEWDMDFSCGDDEDWLFTVHMVGWQPTGQISVMH